MIGQIRPFARAAVHDGEKTLANRLGECRFQERTDVGVDRVHLEDADLPLVEHLREQVHAWNAADVSRAEHQHYSSFVIGGLVELGSAGMHLLLADAGLEMHVDPDSLEQHAVYRAGRKNLYRKPLVGGAADRTDRRVAGVLEREERLLDQPEAADDEPGAQGPLLAFEWGSQGNPFGGAGGLDAGSGDPEIAGLHRAGELHPVIERKFGEPAGVLANPSHRGLDLRLRGWGWSGDWRGAGLSGCCCRHDRHWSILLIRDLAYHGELHLGGDRGLREVSPLGARHRGGARRSGEPPGSASEGERSANSEDADRSRRLDDACAAGIRAEELVAVGSRLDERPIGQGAGGWVEAVRVHNIVLSGVRGSTSALVTLEQQGRGALGVGGDRPARVIRLLPGPWPGGSCHGNVAGR